MKGRKQFYRSCSFYGRSSLVVGYAYAFFQKCEFFTKKSYPQERTSFFSEASPLSSSYSSVYIFHLCTFHVTKKFPNSSDTTFLGGYFGDGASVVLMQSSFDALVGGYYLSISPPDTTFYAVFRNIGHEATITNTPPFVHSLRNADAASRFSLRNFLGVDNWIPFGVDYDLDVLR